MNTGDQDKSIEPELRRQLALHFIRRADESANFSRTLLFAVSSASVGFIVTQIAGTLTACALALHFTSCLMFLISIGIVAFSWDIQRKKADKRFRFMRDNKYEEYLAYDEVVRNSPKLKNYLYDRVALVFIVFGVIFEIAAKFVTVQVPP